MSQKRFLIQSLIQSLTQWKSTRNIFDFFHLSLSFSTMAKELLIIVWLLFGHSSEQPLGQDETYPEFGIGLI